MKAWRCDFGGGLSSLRAVDVERPRPGPGQVLVRVRAVTLNRRELFILQGRYPLPVAPTLVPCCDGAGEVVEAGPGVGSLAPGDRVIGAVFPRWRSGDFSTRVMDQLGGSLDGTLAEYVVLDEAAAVRIPDELEDAQAASLPCAGVTAWHALRAAPSVGTGDTVVTLTSGMVSVFVVRIAAALGATVVVATTSAERGPALRQLGADEVVGAGTGMPEAVLRLTDDRGADLVVHNYGAVDSSVQAARVAGQVSLVTVAGAGSLDLTRSFARNVSVVPISLGTVEQTRELVDFAAAHDITVPLARRFDFERAREAFEYYERDQPFGKVVIEQT